SFLSLGSSPGEIVGENNSRYITAQNGLIQKLMNLNQPNKANPGNLGLEISSLENLGMTLISRGHQAQTLAGLGSERFFQISPSNNVNLGARLRLYYLNHEINGLPEIALELWESSDGLNWLERSPELASSADNWLEISGIDEFNHWTIGVPSLALSFSLNYWRLVEQGDEEWLEWQLSPSDDISLFNIESSPDARQYAIYQTIPYQTGKALYTIPLQDLDKSIQYLRLQTLFKDSSFHLSAPIFLDREADLKIRVFPNPVQETLWLEGEFSDNELIDIQILSMDGKVQWVGQRKGQEVKNGLDVSGLTRGTYLTIWRIPGKRKETLLIHKQ
ncbi:MAG: T9SS type A sorting domain-containing protein, partial [Bacteroidota bacterium]